GLACCITAFIYAMSGPIERVLHVPGVGAVLAVSSGVAPLTTLSLVQEAINRRAFSFRKLALRAFFSQLGGGLIGIVAALLGCGVWS
ncbi:oligosaccharide flippase family protein, partial [Acinetobacter baumannii]